MRLLIQARQKLRFIQEGMPTHSLLSYNKVNCALSGEAVDYGLNKGLIVNAGHGLNYQNVQAIASIPGVSELNIGHVIVAQAIFVGFEQAVREMKRLILEAQ